MFVSERLFLSAAVSPSSFSHSHSQKGGRGERPVFPKSEAGWSWKRGRKEPNSTNVLIFAFMKYFALFYLSSVYHKLDLTTNHAYILQKSDILKGVSNPFLFFFPSPPFLARSCFRLPLLLLPSLFLFRFRPRGGLRAASGRPQGGLGHVGRGPSSSMAFDCGGRSQCRKREREALSLYPIRWEQKMHFPRLVFMGEESCCYHNIWLIGGRNFD